MRAAEQASYYAVRWRHVALGVGVLVVAHVLVYFGLWGWLRSLVGRSPLIAFAASGVLALSIYFGVGTAVAWASGKRRGQEPAIVALIGLLLLFVLQLLAGMLNLFGLLIGAPFCFGAAFVGGRVGEWVRHRSPRQAGRGGSAIPCE